MWSGQGSGWGWGRKPSGVHGSEQSPNPPGYGFENSAQGGPSPSFIGGAWGRPPPRACAERGPNCLQQGGPRHRAAPGVGPSAEAIDGDAEVHYRARSCLRLQPHADKPLGFWVHSKGNLLPYFPALLSGWEEAWLSRKAPPRSSGVNLHAQELLK